MEQADSSDQSNQACGARRFNQQANRPTHRRRDHGVDDPVRRQVPLADAALCGSRRRRTNSSQGESPGDHPKTDVIRSPRACGQFGDNSSDLALLLSKTEQRIYVVK